MIIIKNATTVEFAPPRVRTNQDIVIQDDVIAAVGTGVAAKATAAAPATTPTVIDAAGKIVMPGLVCSHNHYYSGLARGILANIGPTPDFVSTLKNLWWRLDQANNLDSLYSAALTCNLDAIRAGTTTVIDHHAGPRCIRGSLAVLKKAFERAGLRGATCYEVTDRHGEPGMSEGIAENVDFARALDAQAPAGSTRLVEAHIGGHAPCTLPDDALRRMAEVVETTGRGLHVHVAEDRYDVSHSHITYGQDIVDRLDAFGLLNDRSILVHGVYLSAREIALANERDCFLVHNSRSNMNNGVGYNARLGEWRNLALGTDGIGSDMFQEVKHAYFKHRDANGSLQMPDFLSFLAQGNQLNQRVFGGRFGLVQPGYAADLVISDYQAPTPLVDANVAGHLVFGMAATNVETVIVRGAIVYRDRAFPFDVEPLYAEAREQAARLWERMNAIR